MDFENVSLVVRAGAPIALAVVNIVSERRMDVRDAAAKRGPSALELFSPSFIYWSRLVPGQFWLGVTLIPTSRPAERK